MENTYIVYKHTAPNGKHYIGMTKHTLEHRSGPMGKHYRKSSKLFWCAIQKYGWDNFKHIVLIHGLTKEQAATWERKLIKHLKTTDRKYGYNIHPGGIDNEPYQYKERPFVNLAGKNNPMYGKKHNEETRNLISIKVKEARKKYGHPNTGKHRSETTKEKIRLANRAFEGRCKKVYCFELDQIFQSTREVGRELKIDHSAVSSYCRGNRKYKIGGYSFKYV